MSIPGIPSNVTLKFAESWVQERVSKKRFEHIEGVVVVGREIALAMGEDPFAVELACWLHDSCKEIKAKELIEIALSHGMVLTADEEEYGQILHGPVAALTVHKELRITNKDVLSAIAEHTLGGIGMSITSKIVYLADKLEDSRPDEFTEPIFEELNAIPFKGTPNAWHDYSNTTEADLDAAIVVAISLIARNLLKKGKPVQPKAMLVRNHLLKALKKV